MKTAREFLKDNIENSNIPEEHYEWEIAEMMEMYADYYHKQQLILCSSSLPLKDKHKTSFEDWKEENCVKIGKYYQYKFEDILYTEKELSQKYKNELQNL